VPKKVNTSQSSFLQSKSIPKMPEGYYSGDKPNPNLKSFVEAHLKEHPYDPLIDDYDVPAFNQPINTTKATAIYNMHTYWSKKPHDAIQQYIRHYTKPGDLVLDPFCGSGSTALAALLEGRKAIAIDRSPVATFITKNYCTSVDSAELMKAFEELKAKVKPEIDWLYETRCDRCGGKAITAYTVYSQVFQCSRCLTKVPLFDCIVVAGKTIKGKDKKVKVCPICYKKGIEEEISTRGDRFGSRPMLVNYLCENGCKPLRGERYYNDINPRKREFFQKYDLAKIKEIESKNIPYWYPDAELKQFIPYRMLFKKDFRSTDATQLVHFFSKRNLWALSIIFNQIELSSYKSPIKDWLKGSLTGIILGISRMNQYRPNVSFPLNIMVGTYYLPQISKEEYILKHLENKVDRICKGINYINNYISCLDIMISTQDANKALVELQSNSIDYFFTDPPYADSVQYGELNFVWEAWLRLDTHWYDEEIIINELKGKTESDWANMMLLAMKENYRVLKPGRWLSLCYHDTSEGTWSLIQDIMAEAGFIIDNTVSAIFIDTGGKTYNQTQADKVTKRDLVINFRKPKEGEITSKITINGNEDKSTFTEKVRTIIRDHLEFHPGETKDRIYDEVVSSMVRQGVMEAHNFEEILRQIANEIKEPLKKNLFENQPANLFGTHESSRWYLKETELAIEDETESAKEDTASSILSGYIKGYLKSHKAEQGVHYNNLFEKYIHSVTDKPRRSLAEWLPDYFFKTEEGTYRLPQSEAEEKIKAEGRSRGLNRQIKRYLTYLEQAIEITQKDRPDQATLAEWLSHCRKAGLYDLGKKLYEKGGLNPDKLNEELQVEVEEDYQTCIRMLSRDKVASNQKTKRKSPQLEALEDNE